jgi:sugar lactone lactonase YvrE
MCEGLRRRRLAASRPRHVYIWSMPKQKRPFVVEIEAKLTVYAFDEDSARKKVEKAFASGRPLGADVDAGAGVWTNAVVAPERAPGS